MQKAVAVLCLLLGASQAYHFLDDDDEDSLADGLWMDTDESELLYESGGRHVRSVDDEANEVHTCCMKERAMRMSCCGPFGTIRMSPEIHRLNAKCVMEARDRELQSFCTAENGHYHLSYGRRERRSQLGSCVKECIAQNMSLADADGNLIEADVREFVQNKFIAEESLWDDGVVDKIVDNCFLQAKNLDDLMKEKAKLKCNPAADIFARCLWRNLEIKCKKEEQKPRRHCEFRRRLLQFEEERWNNWACKNGSCNDVQ